MEKRIYKTGLLAVLIALSLGLVQAQSGTNDLSAKIVITNSNFAAQSPEKENLNGEWIEIANQGTNAQSLDSWTLSDEQNHVFTFKGFTLQPSSSVKVHSGKGDDTATDLFWNSNQPIWNNKGDVATLKDGSQNTISIWPQSPAGK